MELKRIRSAELPDIDMSVKERVNDGRWTLFRTHQQDADREVAYYITGDASLYRLDKSGKVVSIGAASEAPRIDEIVHFEDVRSPRSISENRHSHWARQIA